MRMPGGEVVVEQGEVVPSRHEGSQRRPPVVSVPPCGIFALQFDQGRVALNMSQ
jgi:hypothetical protein